MSKTHAEFLKYEKKLLSCPFCNGKALFCAEPRLPGEKNNYRAIICDNCKCCTQYHTSFQKAIEVWNTRVNKEAEFLEELKNYIESDLKSRCPCDICDGKHIAYEEVLQKIEQFQAEQKVSDEKI